MRVLLLSRYSRLGASSRLRSFQYLPYLARSGFKITIASLFNDDYIRELNIGNTSRLNILYAYIKRLYFILKASQYDLVWVEKEMLPWIPGWIELGLLSKKALLVVDYDDAIFHRYDQHEISIIRKTLGQKIDALMCRADLVIVGNDYLGERAKLAGARNIQLLPTVVDTNRYEVQSTKDDKQLTIGWIGQASTAKYLKKIVPILHEIITLYHVRIVAVGANSLQFKNLPIEVRPWSEDTEIDEIMKFDIGIMPLSNHAWEKGKCGYKLIQYMACGKPVIASPIGVNNIIIQKGVNGLLAKSDEEWLKAFKMLCESSDIRKNYGKEGRKKVEQEYCLKITAPKLEKLFLSVLKNRT